MGSLHYKIKRTFPNVVFQSFKDFILLWGEDIGEHNYVKIAKIDRQGNWVLKPICIMDYQQPFYRNSSTEIGALSYIIESDSTYLISFSIEDYKIDNSSTVFLKRLDHNLTIVDSTSFTFDFLSFDYSNVETYLVNNDGLYLLLCRVQHNNGSELYYRILNDKLIPQTDFVYVAKYINQLSPPISVNDGFILTWVDDEVIEGNLRSILINRESKASEIINIMSGDIKSVFNYEYNSTNLDFYIQTKNNFIRKRVEFSAYNFR